MEEKKGKEVGQEAVPVAEGGFSSDVGGGKHG